MNRQILNEKQRNSELENRIKELEAQQVQGKSNQVNEPVSVPPVPNPVTPNPEPSKLEMLLEKAMDRMSTIEEQLKQSQTTAVKTPEPVSHVKKVVESQKHVASSKDDGSMTADDDIQDGDQMDSDSDEEDVDNYITTPDGHKVPFNKMN